MSASFVDWYVERHLSVPTHCPQCRETRRAQSLAKLSDQPKRRGRARRERDDDDDRDETPRPTSDGIDGILARRLLSQRAG
jgi:hypothetical protein